MAHECQRHEEEQQTSAEMLYPIQTFKTEEYDDYELNESSITTPTTKLSAAAVLPASKSGAYVSTSMENDELAVLLKQFNLYDELYDFLKGKELTIEGLLYMKERHLDELFGGENLNTKIIFEHKLGLWQQRFGVYYLTPSQRDAARNMAENWAMAEINDKPDDGILSIRDVLCQSEEGKRILEIYNDTKELSVAHRTTVVHKVVQYFVEKNLKISVQQMRRVAEEIVFIFPTETVETYFMQTNKRMAPKGKLWDRYQSRKRHLKKLCLYDQAKKCKTGDELGEMVKSEESPCEE